MFIAPLLAVIAYLSVDNVVSEKPHAAVEGGQYKLLARSNCRYKSGLCTLENGDIKIKLHLEKFDNKTDVFFLSSTAPIKHVLISFVDKNNNAVDIDDTEPLYMQADAERLGIWSIPFNQSNASNNFLRLVVSISNALYYAETSTVFLDYETSFSRDNFSN